MREIGNGEGRKEGQSFKPAGSSWEVWSVFVCVREGRVREEGISIRTKERRQKVSVVCVLTEVIIWTLDKSGNLGSIGEKQERKVRKRKKSVYTCIVYYFKGVLSTVSFNVTLAALGAVRAAGISPFRATTTTATCQFHENVFGFMRK